MPNVKFDDEKTAVPSSVHSTQYSVLSTQHQVPSTAPSRKKLPRRRKMPKNTASHTAHKKEETTKRNLQFSIFADEKTATRLDTLLSQILKRKELIAHDAAVVASWKTYRGKRLGPYYRLVYRDKGKFQALYIGRNEELACAAQMLIDKLKQPRRQDLYLRQLRQSIRASLRKTNAELETLVAPLGFYRRGWGFCKRRFPAGGDFG